MSSGWNIQSMKRAKLPNPGHCAYSLRRIAFAFRGHLRPHTKAECAVCVCIDVSLGWKPPSFVGARRLRRCSTAECERALLSTAPRRLCCALGAANALYHAHISDSPSLMNKAHEPDRLICNRTRSCRHSKRLDCI